MTDVVTVEKHQTFDPSAHPTFQSIGPTGIREERLDVSKYNISFQRQSAGCELDGDPKARL